MNKRKKDDLKTVLVALLYLLTIGCNSSGDKNSKLNAKRVENDSVSPVTILDTTRRQRYIDSLNELKDFKNMPYFLSDSCLDANAIYWEDLHHPASMRKYVIDHTTNMDLLKYIVKNNLYTNKCNSISPNKSIPFYNLSLNDMAKERIDTLLRRH